MPDKRAVAVAGEDAAAKYLARQGFRILHRNLHLGRAGELDIVARHGPALVFVEVKSKLAGEALGGLQNITTAKQQKIWELGGLYLRKYGGDHTQVRFDAVEVEFADGQLKRSTIRHIPDAWRG